ncbi:putative protein kinase [Trypanosoma rangeli]|uniref:Protein kinase domain-containing protein n=1 Tax=Trypanosoma rangeli TaxID=5698 RepID=A0A422NIF0_TRYRA|nr:putative protein kinase [Trypanosoma rangeli]RNF05258.1 putative protein kinase [Trypanosoma rangeli]|eukprot:RNF05258.1 putative protein kinase [Trypanosoma rangeli]
MRRQGKETTQRGILLPAGCFTIEAERAEEAPCMNGLSPTSGGIITPRRIVRSLNVSPAVNHLVPLDSGSERPPSTAPSSGTLLSEEVVDDLVSEPVSVTGMQGEKFPALGVYETPAIKLTSSANCGTPASRSPSLTRVTSADSLYSSSSLITGSSAQLLSHDYTDLFDPESVYSCSLTCVGDKFGAVTPSRRTSTPAVTAAAVPVAVAANTPATSPPAALFDRRVSETSIAQIVPRHEGSNTAEVGRRPKIINVRREERIGRGGFGDIFRAIDLDTGLPLVIKEILVMADISKDVELQLRALEREIRVMRKLDHKHIVCYYSARREEASCALQIYMEYVGGGTIAQKLRENGPFSEDETRNYTQQLLEGLEYLHQRRIVHRDLKGDNLLLTEDGVLKVGDFGTSKDLQTTLVTDSVAGTPNFMAPEVIACSGHSCMADIWSVGCCVLEMLTGHPPLWNLDNHMAVMFAIMKGRLEEQVPPHISGDAKDFIGQCLRSDPKERPSAAQLQQHPWLRFSEKAKTAEGHAHSYLSLSGAQSLEEEGKQREREGTTHEGTPALGKVVFPGSTAPVLAAISDRGNDNGGVPSGGPRSRSQKTIKRKQLPDLPMLSSQVSSLVNAHPSGRMLYPRPPHTTALNKGQLNRYANRIAGGALPYRNGVGQSKGGPHVGCNAVGGHGVSPSRKKQKKSITASELFDGGKKNEVKQHATAGLEATTCTTR